MKPLIKSARQGIVWPAMPEPMGAQLLAALGQLEQSQWWPEERIEQYQRKQLKGLLQYARESVPWYRDNWADHPSTESLVEDPGAWLDLPIVERATIHAGEQAFVSKHLPHNHGSLKTQRAYGTGGQSLDLHSTAVTRFLRLVFELRNHDWQGREARRRLLFVGESGSGSDKFAQKRPSWCEPVSMVYHTGPALQIDPQIPMEQLLHQLIAFRPNYLNLTPMILRELNLLAELKGAKLPAIQGIDITSGSVDSDLRAQTQQVWGLEINDLYSAPGFGIVALHCPVSGLYHIQAENILLEVLDKSGGVCKTGETGDVVVTSLTNFGMPLIRFKLGDQAEVGAPCVCGRGLPTLKRVIEQTRAC